MGFNERECFGGNLLESTFAVGQLDPITNAAILPLPDLEVPSDSSSPSAVCDQPSDNGVHLLSPQSLSPCHSLGHTPSGLLRGEPKAVT
jgi:hypothetical protein